MSFILLVVWTIAVDFGMVGPGKANRRVFSVISLLLVIIKMMIHSSSHDNNAKSTEI